MRSRHRGEETSLNTLADVMLTVMGSSLRPEYAAERKVHPVPRRLADIGKARRMLGFEPTVGLEEGIERLVAWWQEERCASQA